MRTNLTRLISSVCAVVASVSIAAHAQKPNQATATGPGTPRPELALGYNYLRSNAPAGNCGCFSLNGGNFSFAIPVSYHHLAIVGDVAAAHAGNVNNTGNDLTLSTYTAGFRYTLPTMRSRFSPFAEVLAGLAHSSGSLVDTNASSTSNKGAALASLIGGGVDLRASRHYAIRLVEADYLVTTIDNGSNDHQNNLRISTGVVFRF